MDERRQKENYIHNWRSIYEDAIFSLVATAMKRSNFHIDQADLPSIIEISNLYLETDDMVSINNMAKVVLEWTRNEVESQNLRLDELGELIRSLVMKSINGKIQTKLAFGKLVNKKEYSLTVNYAKEQIERDRELGFEQLAYQMQEALAFHDKINK